MKHFMLAALASVALALPAMAQSNDSNMMQRHDQPQMGAQPAAGRIDPSQLSPQQIRQIQMTLNRKGFDADRADGKWGPQTQAALKNFQKKQHIEGAGQLDTRTLAALGVNENGQSWQGSPRQGAATTGAGSDESRTNAPSHNPGAMNDGAGSQSSPSSGPAVNGGH
jgi:peptidoglycan hydrolase-like protein with peptidoglycan-binding domain